MKKLFILTILVAFSTPAPAQDLLKVSPILTCSAYYAAQSATVKGLEKEKRIELSAQLRVIANNRHGKSLVDSHIDKLQAEMVSGVEKAGNLHLYLLGLGLIEECRGLTRENGIAWTLYD